MDPCLGYQESWLLIGQTRKLACNFITKAHGYITWLTYLQKLVIWVLDFKGVGHDYSQLFKFSTMAKYYREISQLLALGEESFEDELRWIVSDY